MPRRVLILLSQLPHDPASGAARTVKNIGELLATRGHAVECVAVTASEHVAPDDPVDVLHRAGAIPAPSDADRRAGTILRFTQAGVQHHLLNTGRARILGWSPALEHQFNELFDERLRDFKPDIVFTYGGHPAELRRQYAARDRGCAIAFALQNHSYFDRRAFVHVDAVWTPSRYLARAYRERIGLESTSIFPPLMPAEVIAANPRPHYFTFVNPSREKGVMLFARLAEELSIARPAIPLLVIDARGTARQLIEAGLAGGFDLRRHKNILNSPGVANPSLFLAQTRVMLVPSVGAEAASRVAAEALVNGVPPIASERGGLPEVVATGGAIVPLPPTLKETTSNPVSHEEVRPWVEAVLRWYDDPAAYFLARESARRASTRFLPEVLAPQFDEFFEAVRRR